MEGGRKEVVGEKENEQKQADESQGKGERRNTNVVKSPEPRW